MREQWCCGGPAAEMGYVDLARKHAEHNVADWRAVGAKRIIAPDPHDFIAFTEDYPRYFGDDYEFEIVLGVELVNDLVKEGRIALTQPVERTVTYHDPCRLNKRKGVHAAPRELLRAVPGIEFRDVDHVTQWSYCSGGGGGLPIEKPEITAEISRRRVARAQELEVDTLISACPWSERPLSEAGAAAEQPLEVMDLFELVAQSAGIEVGGHTHAPRRRGAAMSVAFKSAVDDAVIDELRAIIGDDDRVLPNLVLAREPHARPGAVPRAPLGRPHARRRRPPAHRGGGLRDRQARQPAAASRSSRAPAAPGSPTAPSRCAAASSSTSS